MAYRFDAQSRGVVGGSSATAPSPRHFPTTRTVDNHILRLRQKLEADPADPRFILSVYGEGYKFVG
jgi:DNA-binding response OmpR family regulator